MKKFILIFLSFLTACATHTPIPRPAPACDMTIAGKCYDMSASEKSGAVVRGHGEEIKDVK